MSADDDDRTVIRPTGMPGAAPQQKTMTAIPPTMRGGAPSPAADHEAPNALPVGTSLGEFEITAFVGEGGFGIVYEAYDHSLQRRVALKEYMPSSLAARTTSSQVSVKSERHRETFQAGLKSFINEARLLASFDHPSLVKVYRFWEANGTAYMVMPFLEGVTLKDCLRAMSTPPDEAWLMSVLAPVTEALVVIHHEQCFHRDIAPDNIMQLASNNRWLVLDFGAARRVIGDMTQALTVILKPGYAPVEQYAEIPGMKQGAWTDVYALAAVVHFAITGKTPPPSVGRLLNDTYVPLSQAAAGRYSPGFLAAVDRALAVRPEDRTPTIEQFREELGLGPVSSAEPYTTRPLAPGAVPPRPPVPPTSAMAPPPFAPPVSAPMAPPVAPPVATPTAAAPAASTRPAPMAAPAPAAQAAAAGGSRTGVYAAVGVVVLAGLGFGAYKAWFPAPRPAPAPAVVQAPAPPPAVSAALVAAPVAPPAAAPAAPPAPAATAATLDPAQEFDRVVQGQTAGFGVQAVAEKNTLRIGHDGIRFTVQAERDGHLYVFAASSEGELVLVVPNSTSGAVRVKKGQRYRFPTGDGVELDATEPPGPVRLLAVVTARQRDFSALEPKALGTMRQFATGPASAGLMARHAGPQPVLLGRTICPASGPCEDDYGAAQFQVDVVR
ncbi:MAG: serine/threonine-protein kinase [Rubrivivax sp.]